MKFLSFGLRRKEKENLRTSLSFGGGGVYFIKTDMNARPIIFGFNVGFRRFHGAHANKSKERAFGECQDFFWRPIGKVYILFPLFWNNGLIFNIVVVFDSLYVL